LFYPNNDGASIHTPNNNKLKSGTFVFSRRRFLVVWANKTKNEEEKLSLAGP
jgi:hypothetical protein